MVAEFFWNTFSMDDRDNRNPKRPDPDGRKGPGQAYKGMPGSWLIIGLILLAILLAVGKLNGTEELTYNQFLVYLEKDQVDNIQIKESEIIGELKESALQDKKTAKAFKVNFDRSMLGQELTKKLEAMQQKGSAIKWSLSNSDMWLLLLANYLFPILLLVGLFYFLFIRGSRTGAGGMLMNFGRSKHRVRGKEQTKVTFKDVAGIEEAKEEVTETIEFLKNPKKFQRLGGRIPRGVLLIGPPGCGKTLLAKAIAGEADVPFFSISGSDFVEMFVGVGASRVRDLFRQAKENSPCIIFLDEIDAIGRKRGPGFVSGGHDEREQTLNAILVEMDGFDTDDQVIVIAATNRNDILDPALTRPGRFDRQIFVPLPDVKGRMEILNVHARKVKMSPDVDMKRIARGTSMFSGAELAAIINEAAIMATMANKDYVETADLEEARDKVRWGRAKRSRVVEQKDREDTAYHEAGHTLVQCLVQDADPLHKVSIIPRGRAAGATFALPEKDRMFFTKKYCMAEIQVCLGGRIAEEIFCNDISSGASHDIHQATGLARMMVESWGMSEQLGMVDYTSNNEGAGMWADKDRSDKTSELIDREIRRIIDEAYKLARDLVLANREKVEVIAKALLKYETLDAEEVKLLLAGGELDKPTVTDLLAIEQERGVKDAAGASPDQP
jgi:cell division protease FtsH